MNGGEQLLSELVTKISQGYPLDLEEMRNELSHILANYHIQRCEPNKVSPDLQEKINMFIIAKTVERLSEVTLYNYESELDKFAEVVKKRTEEITTADIRVFLGSNPKWKASTLSKKLAIIKSFFGWLAGEELILRDPSAKLKTPRKEKRDPKALNVEELEMLREGCVTLRERAFIEVFYATGCRLGEVVGMDIKHIDQRNMSTQVIGKGEKQRDVYFSFKAMYHLNKYLNSRTDNNEALFVLERKPHTRLGHRGIEYVIKTIAERAGLAGKVHPHVLRHTFATLTLNNGAELVAVQELLGHSSPETTLWYAKITEERKREQHKKFLIQ